LKGCIPRNSALIDKCALNQMPHLALFDKTI
jgi:hypothetical protein